MAAARAASGPGEEAEEGQRKEGQEGQGGEGHRLGMSPAEVATLQGASGKLQLLAEMLPRLRDRGHRVLLFCQMTR